MKTLDVEIEYFDIGDEISVKVPEGTLTMTVVDVEEFDVGGDTEDGGYCSGTIYEAMGVEGVKLNGEKSSVYTDEHANQMFANRSWSVSCVDGRGRDDCDRYGGAENY